MANKDLMLSYEACKNFVLSYFRNKQLENQTDKLKEKYKSVINSPRRYEEIKDLQSLFKILEKRGKLSYVDIHVLEDIYDELGITKNILECHNKLIKSSMVRGHNAENQASRNNTSFRDTRSKHNISGHSHYKGPESINSNSQGLSQRDSQRITGGNTPSQSSGPQAEEEIFPIPVLTLFNETVNIVSRGYISDKKSIKNAQSSKIQEKDPTEVFVDKICISAMLIFIILGVVCFILYKVYELMSSANEICLFTLGWLLLNILLKYCLLFSISCYKNLLLFVRNIHEKGLNLTLLQCAIVIFYKLFWTVDIEEEAVSFSGTFLVSRSVTLFNCVIWFGKSLYNRGMVPTML